MQIEIQHLIDHPEAIREALNTAKLDRLIREATAIWGQRITMRYRVSEGRASARFEAESEEDLVGSAGIFSKVLTECKIDTFGSALDYTPEEGYRVWFVLHLSYRHFEGGSNGMSIATFRYKNGEWTMSHYKGEEED